MHLTTKLLHLLPTQTGTGKNGEWKKQDIIVETDGQYPKKICISVWGDKINSAILQEGNLLKIDFDIESREYNGKWYTDVKAIKIENQSLNQQEQNPVDIASTGIDKLPWENLPLEEFKADQSDFPF
jgi:hypothetical protein